MRQIAQAHLKQEAKEWGKWTLYGLIALFLIWQFGTTSASGEFQTLGTFNQGSIVELTQNCADSTYSNITKIQLAKGNSTIFYQGQIGMTKNGDDYNASVTYSNVRGQYLVYGHCDENGEKVSWRYDYYIGEELNQGTSTFYGIMLAILGVFFVMSLIGLFNTENPNGRLAFYWVSHILFIAIIFLAWDLSAEFLTQPNFIIGFFRIMFWISIISVIPMFFLSFFWIIKMHLLTKEVQRLMDRGFDPDEAYSKAMGGKAW